MLHGAELHNCFEPGEPGNERHCTYARAIQEHLFGDPDIPPMKQYLGEWFRQSDYGFIHAPRGVGKSWLCMLIAKAISTGADLGPWSTGENPVKTLYIDGEMMGQQIKQRLWQLDCANENLLVLNPEIAFRLTTKVYNFSEPHFQKAMTLYVIKKGVKVLILDNLSSLTRGAEENSVDDWESILSWILQLRMYDGKPLECIFLSKKSLISASLIACRRTLPLPRSFSGNRPAFKSPIPNRPVLE